MFLRAHVRTRVMYVRAVQQPDSDCTAGSAGPHVAVGTQVLMHLATPSSSVQLLCLCAQQITATVIRFVLLQNVGPSRAICTGAHSWWKGGLGVTLTTSV